MNYENILKSKFLSNEQKLSLLKLMKSNRLDSKTNFDYGVKGMKWGHHKQKEEEISEHHQKQTSQEDIEKANTISSKVNEAKAKAENIPHRKVDNNSEFSDAFLSAKNQRNPEDTWRVSTDYVGDDDALNDMGKFCTDGGSTVAVKSNGDIVSVCHNLSDKSVRGKDLMNIAIANGGRKLDSYSGNHRFYTRNGMTPVSWCEWCDDFAPDEWIKANGFSPDDDSWKSKSNDELKVKREPIIFYAYDGKGTSETANEFMQRVHGCSGENGYSEAEEARDGFLSKLKSESEEE